MPQSTGFINFEDLLHDEAYSEDHWIFGDLNAANISTNAETAVVESEDQSTSDQLDADAQ